MFYNEETNMRRTYWFLIPSLLTLFCILGPQVTHAAISSVFQPIIAQGGACGCTGSTPAPDWNCVLQTTQILINDFVTFATIVITIFIAWAGFTYILSPTSPEKRQQANARILNAVIGLVIVLCAWLLVNTVMGVLYNGEFGPWNSILTSSGGTNCIIAKGPPPSLGTAIGGLLAGNNTSSTGNAAGGPPVAGGVGGSTANAPLNASGAGGACSASNVQSSAAAEGVNISSSDANTLACLAQYESNCGAVNQNYKWGNGSSAYGAFQITLQSNAQYLNNPACESAVGATGPLNCQQGFSGGNPIPGSSIAATCERAAANLGCSAAAAAALYDQSGIKNWTADPNASKQGSCGS